MVVDSADQSAQRARLHLHQATPFGSLLGTYQQPRHAQESQMPASPCRTYSDPLGKAAWDALNAAETRLEEFLKKRGGTAVVDGVAAISGMGYFLNEQEQLMCGPLYSDGRVDKETALHRTDYEGFQQLPLYLLIATYSCSTSPLDTPS